MGNKIKLSKELSHGNGLWVQCPVDDPLLSVALLIHERQRVGQNMQYFGLSSKRLPYQHETDREMYFKVQNLDANI